MTQSIFLRFIFSTIATSSIICSTYCQSIDSLLTIFNELDNSIEKAEIAGKLIPEYDNINSVDSALYYGDIALALYREYKDLEGEATTHLSIANTSTKYRKFEKALLSLEEAKRIYTNLKNEDKLAKISSQYGTLYAWKSETPQDNIKAKEYLLEAVSYKIENNLLYDLRLDYFYLAYVYSNDSDNQKALVYYYKCIEILRDPSHGHELKTNLLAAAYANSGSIYLSANEVDLSIEYYLLALETLPQNASLHNLAIMYSNLGILYRKKGFYKNSFEYFYKNYNLVKDFKSPSSLLNNYYQRGITHLEQNNLDSTLYFISTAEKTLSEYGESRDDIRELSAEYFFKQGQYENAVKVLELNIEEGHTTIETLKGLYKNYKQLGDYEKSLKYHEWHHKKNDSIRSSDRIPAVNLSNTMHEISLAKKEAVRDQKERLTQSQSRDFLQYSGILIILIILFLVMNMSIKMNLPSMIIKGISFLTILTLFEFTLVFLDPKIDILTTGEPVYKLAINMSIAVLIFPIHNFFEKRLDSKQI